LRRGLVKGGPPTMLAALMLLLGGPVYADVLYREDFMNGLTGWTAGPPAHAGFLSMGIDSGSHGVESPSLRVDVPLHTFNYHVRSPRIALPRLDASYTLRIDLRLDQPDCPFQVAVAIYDRVGAWIGLIPLDEVAGQEGGFRTFEFVFQPSTVITGSGTCAIMVGLPFVKVLHEGTFWLDDVEVREGGEPRPLELYLTPGSVGGRPRSMFASDRILGHDAIDRLNQGASLSELLTETG
jgi:hypothetical protein